jgi:hypothetical protein
MLGALTDEFAPSKAMCCAWANVDNNLARIAWAMLSSGEDYIPAANGSVA